MADQGNFGAPDLSHLTEDEQKQVLLVLQKAKVCEVIKPVNVFSSQVRFRQIFDCAPPLKKFVSQNFVVLRGAN